MRGRQGRFSFGVQHSAEARILRYTLYKKPKEANPIEILCLIQGCDFAAKSDHIFNGN
jgi:hypothetical protein